MMTLRGRHYPYVHLRDKKTKNRGGESLAQRHAAGRWQSQNVNTGRLTPELLHHAMGGASGAGPPRVG